jgi:hypothetical protein
MLERSQHLKPSTKLRHYPGYASGDRASFTRETIRFWKTKPTAGLP